jgi:DNA-binding transcriptional ArsR family regulator
MNRSLTMSSKTSTRSRARSPKTPIDQMRAHVSEVSDFLKTLANEKRLLVLCTLLEGEQSVGELNSHIELSASALSQHLAWLREAGLVATRREAQTIYYRIADPRVMAVIKTLKQQFCS